MAREWYELFFERRESAKKAYRRYIEPFEEDGLAPNPNDPEYVKLKTRYETLANLLEVLYPFRNG